jgi:hypothetical protein
VRTASSSTSSPAEPGGEEPPPFLGTWRRVYAAVILELALLVLLFRLLAGWAS